MCQDFGGSEACRIGPLRMTRAERLRMQIASDGRLQETEPFGETNVWVLGVLKSLASLGWNRRSQSTSLDTEGGNGLSPSGFNHCNFQASGSSGFGSSSSRNRPRKGISAANLS